MTIGEVAGTQVLIKWGIDSYLTPVKDHKYAVNNTIVKNTPRENFAYAYAMGRKWVPAPGEHMGHPDWPYVLSGPSGASP